MADNERPTPRPRRPTRDIPPLPQGDQTGQEEKPNHSADALTPLRAHYLKKSLIQLQFDRELDNITSSTPNNISTLSYLGPPFSPPPKDAPPMDLPFLRYIFRQFVITFPFMATAPKNFYSDKLQPFVANVLARNLSPVAALDDPEERSEEATRLKLLARIERNLSLFVGAGTKLVEPEEVVRLKQSDLDRLETLAQKRMARQMKQKDTFEVNIVSVRTVTDKGRMRSRVHEVCTWYRLEILHRNITQMTGIHHSDSPIQPTGYICISQIWRFQDVIGRGMLRSNSIVLPPS